MKLNLQYVVLSVISITQEIVLEMVANGIYVYVMVAKFISGLKNNEDLQVRMSFIMDWSRRMVVTTHLRQLWKVNTPETRKTWSHFL